MNEPLLLTLICLCIIAGGHLAGKHLPMVILALLSVSSLGTCLYAYVGIMKASFTHGVPNAVIFIELVLVPILCFVASMWVTAIRRKPDQK